MGPLAGRQIRWPNSFVQGQRPPGGSVALTRWLCGIDLRDPPAVLPLNGFDKRLSWSGTEFVAPQKGPFTNRPVYYGNRFYSLGARVPLLLNHCDGQGWEYAAMWPELIGTGIFQYCRLPGQVGQVILVPLNPAYAGPGTDALPEAGYDPKPFRAKIPKVVWRGRVSGSRQVQGWTVWAEGLFAAICANPAANLSEQTENLLTFPRLQASQVLAGQPWADAGITLLAPERRALAGRPLPPALRPLQRAPLSRAQQLQSRYVLCIDGNDIPSGVYWALQSNSVVFRMSEGWETALDFGLRPWEHYVPIAPDGSDLEAAFYRCEADPAMCEEMIANAHRTLAWAVDPEVRGRIDREVLNRYAENLLLDTG
jgi:hypothetical protein